jgi:hypothetical protein
MASQLLREKVAPVSGREVGKLAKHPVALFLVEARRLEAEVVQIGIRRASPLRLSFRS